MSQPDPTPDWKHDGVRVVKAGQLDTDTPQTPGMNRAAAINRARAGAEKLWAGTVTIHPNAKTGAHHHGELESVLFVLQDQEINASTGEPLECVVVRSGQEPIIVNLEIATVEPPEEVRWVDPIHPDQESGGSTAR